MADRLKKAVQYGLNTMQYYKRTAADLLTYADVPPATQRWMCPNCNRIHDNVPIDLSEYRCICAWHGNRTELLLARGEVYKRDELYIHDIYDVGIGGVNHEKR